MVNPRVQPSFRGGACTRKNLDFSQPIDVACLLVCVNFMRSQIVGGVELMRFQT